MSIWQIRHEGAPNAVTVPSAGEILTGLRDGLWLPTDEVKGPADADWQSLENHPTFAEAAEELEHPPVEGSDETHLDMNPLIDVCLVLLIFFILTITYASLERAIAVPEDQPDTKGQPTKPPPDLKDRVFKVVVRMDGNNVVIKIADEVTPLDQVEQKIKSIIDRTGRKEMYLDIDGVVPWGVQTSILDAAKGNGVHQIFYRPKQRR